MVLASDRARTARYLSLRLFFFSRAAPQPMERLEEARTTQIICLSDFTFFDPFYILVLFYNFLSSLRFCGCIIRGVSNLATGLYWVTSWQICTSKQLFLISLRNLDIILKNWNSNQCKKYSPTSLKRPLSGKWIVAALKGLAVHHR